MGDVLTEVGVAPILGVNFLSELGEEGGSFLGEIFNFVGETGVLIFCPSCFSSSRFFINASLVLALSGTVFFWGEGLITSSNMLLLGLVFESELLFLGDDEGIGFSLEPVRA